jgi:methylated-DNA-[protein]-cysteine S-methyltransferase
MTQLLTIAHTAPTPLGIIYVLASDQGIAALSLATPDACLQRARELGASTPLWVENAFPALTRQVEEYLAGKRMHFDVTIDWRGITPFHQRVLQKVMSVEYGAVASYTTIAKSLGYARAARAIGRANATNPVPLIIPCHRIIAASGGLGGYSAGEGLATKQWLLALEKARCC